MANRGDSFVMAVHLTDPIQGVSIRPLGNCNDANSSHYTQRTTLFCQDRFKPAWFTDTDIEANTLRSYRPGE